MRLQAKPLVAGNASGALLRLRAPLSFWGGVDARTGQIVDAQSDGFGRNIAGHVLVLAALRGSSSSSSVLLELIHNGHAPAALIVAEPDAILIAGLLAAREMGWAFPPLLELAASEQDRLAEGEMAIQEDGLISSR